MLSKLLKFAVVVSLVIAIARAEWLSVDFEVTYKSGRDDKVGKGTITFNNEELVTRTTLTQQESTQPLTAFDMGQGAGLTVSFEVEGETFTHRSDAYFPKNPIVRFEQGQFAGLRFGAPLRKTEGMSFIINMDKFILQEGKRVRKGDIIYGKPVVARDPGYAR